MNTADYTKELYDIYGMWHVPFWQTRFFWIALVLFLTVLGSALAWYLIFRYWRKKKIEKPWDKALRMLKALSIGQQVSKEEGKRFYFKLTVILKIYLSERYGLYVFGNTDQELLSLLKQSSFPADLLPLIHDIFTGCLRIKYANEKALQEQLVQDHASAIRVIQKTRLFEKKE